MNYRCIHQRMRGVFRHLIALTGMFLLMMVAGNGYGQEITLDFKYHDVGQVRQLITNKGNLWHAGLPDVEETINCIYPVGSYEEHLGEGGIWVGAITPQFDTLVTVSSSWNPHFMGGDQAFEFWPFSSEPWDTIWVADRGEVLDIPYWPGYTGFSDQDFITRYNDYNPVSLTFGTHNPLYVDVIQVSHTWASPEPLNEIIVYDYYVIPTQFKLRRTFITMWVDPNIGQYSSDWQTFLTDDYSLYYPDLRMGVGVDAEGGEDGESLSPIGFKILPPEGYNPNLLQWSFIWGSNPNPPGITPFSDGDKYRELMAASTIMDNQQTASGSHFVLSFGPFDLGVSDTLHFQVVQILGEGLEGVLRTARQVETLAERDFRFPSPPPTPPLTVETDNHTVTLSWEPDGIAENPEMYEDPNRADNVSQPFEGYRVYKKYKETYEDGTYSWKWKLLAEYDIAANGYGKEIGLEYTYKDEGLLNNVEYYYSVTAFSKEDTVLGWPSTESSLSANEREVVPGPEPPATVNNVAVVPNPYRGDIDYSSYVPAWESPPGSRNFWMEQDRKIQFINLPQRCEIRIYTVAGDLVQTIRHDDPDRGYENWNLTSSVGQAISSGIYMYTVEDLTNGEIQPGKFVIIK